MNKKAWTGLCLVVILLAAWALGPVPAFAMDEDNLSGITEVKAGIGYTIQFASGDGSGSMEPVFWTKREAYELPPCAFTAPEKKAFKKWSVVIGEAEAVSKAPNDTITVTANTTVTAVWEDVASLKVITTSFKDRLQLNYYYKLPANVLADENAYLLVTKGNASSRLPVKDATLITESDDPDRIGCHMFSYRIAAKEARDNVNVALFYSNGTRVQTVNSDGTKNLTESGYDFTAMTYLDYMSEHGSDKMKALALAAKDYCTAAQLHFNYNVESIGSGNGVRALVDAVSSGNLAADYSSVKTGDLPAGIDLDIITVMFESDNAFRLYYTYDDVDTRNSYTYTVDGGSATLKQRSTDGKYYIEKTGVPARLLHKPHDYAVSKGGKTYTYTASMMTYAKTAMDNGTESMKTLAKAFYLYNQAAIAYFGDDT